MKSLPNILTIGRLVLTLVALVCLVGAVGAPQLRLWAFVAFVIAAITDFFDGWLARRLNATSTLGAILDPIADKTLVAAAIVGLAASDPHVAFPGGLILCREFAVSALRETLAPKGLKLPVTMLAKWKTTLQLIALGVLIFAPTWSMWGLPPGVGGPAHTALIGGALLWLATLVTIWTGIEYALAAHRALKSR
jgi:CDP-diacylglycerol--glycerol-3-phosphate 3-phosphatidyltransferase